jgi:hypothetical protein
MADEPTDEITIDILDDGTATVVDAPVIAGSDTQVVATTPVVAATDDPNEGIESGRADAERRAALADQEAKRSAAIASDSQFDSIANALNASEREMEHLVQLKRSANEEGRHDDAAKIDAQMSKVGARVVQFETAKAQLEEERKRAPAVVEQTMVQPTVSDDQRREQFLANLPPQSAAWIRGLPNNRYFTDPAFAAKVNAAAQYAEQVKGINHNSGEYFRFIEQEIGMATAPVATSVAAATVQERHSATPRVAAPVSAAPSRSVPDAVGHPKRASQVTLSADERAHAKMMFSGPEYKGQDPEVLYAKNKLALINDPRSSYGRTH